MNVREMSTHHLHSVLWLGITGYCGHTLVCYCLYGRIILKMSSLFRTYLNPSRIKFIDIHICSGSVFELSNMNSLFNNIIL